MESLRGILERRRLRNEQVVLIGDGEQLFLCGASPGANLGETVNDPLPDEFPLRLYVAATTDERSDLAAAPRLPPPSSWSECGEGVERPL